uniref:uncharacterized protein n=1 Tax=Myxine glutinosa TaxID=7769 RepID=UPI00358DE0A6
MLVSNIVNVKTSRCVNARCRHSRGFFVAVFVVCQSKKETEPPLVDGAAHVPASAIKGPLNSIVSQTKEVASGWTPQNSPKLGQQVKRKVSQRSDLGSSASSISSNSSGRGNSNSNSNSNNNLGNIHSSCTVAEEHSVTAIRPCLKVPSSNTESTMAACPALKCEPSGSALQRRFLQLMGQRTQAQQGVETKMKCEEALEVELKRKGREFLPARRFRSPFKTTRRVRSHSGVRGQVSADASEEAEHPTLLSRKEDTINARGSTSGLPKVLPVAVDTDCKQSQRPRGRFPYSLKLGQTFRSHSSDNVPR